MNRPNDAWMDGWILVNVQYACMFMIERAIWDVGLYNSEKLAL